MIDCLFVSWWSYAIFLLFLKRHLNYLKIKDQCRYYWKLFERALWEREIIAMELMSKLFLRSINFFRCCRLWKSFKEVRYLCEKSWKQVFIENCNTLLNYSFLSTYMSHALTKCQYGFFTSFFLMGE